MDSVCEPEAAVERLGGDLQLYRELVQSFLDDSAGLLPRLASALAAGDCDGVHRAAHCLKGTAATCGAIAVANVCAELERTALEKDLGNGRERLDELQSRVREAAGRLAAYYVPAKE
jgi:two-component system, sensor histidine kinase and response regulator